MQKVRVERIDDDIGIVFSDDMIAALGVVEGDEVIAVKTPRGYELSRHDASVVTELPSRG